MLFSEPTVHGTVAPGRSIIYYSTNHRRAGARAPCKNAPDVARTFLWRARLESSTERTAPVIRATRFVTDQPDGSLIYNSKTTEVVNFQPYYG